MICSTGVKQKFEGKTFVRKYLCFIISFWLKNIILKLSECDLTCIIVIIHVCYKPVSSTFYILLLHYQPVSSTSYIFLLHYQPVSSTFYIFLLHYQPVSSTFYIFLLHYRILKVAYLVYDMIVIKIQNAQFIFIGF